jgi:hypothetical protein
MSKPAGFVSVRGVFNAVLLTTTNGSKLAGFDHLAIEGGCLEAHGQRVERHVAPRPFAGFLPLAGQDTVFPVDVFRS